MCNLREAPVRAPPSGLGCIDAEIYREGLQGRALGRVSSFLQSAGLALGLPGLGNTPIHCQKAWREVGVGRLQREGNSKEIGPQDPSQELYVVRPGLCPSRRWDLCQE